MYNVSMTGVMRTIQFNTEQWLVAHQFPFSNAFFKTTRRPKEFELNRWHQESRRQARGDLTVSPCVP